MPSISRKHRGILIDGYAVVVFQDEIVVGAVIDDVVDIPIRGAFIRPLHCKISWSNAAGYRISKIDVKAEIKVNGCRTDGKELNDGDIITLGRPLNPQLTFRFQCPYGNNDSAVLYLLGPEAAFDLLHLHSLSLARTRHILLLREYGTIGHSEETHIHVPNFPCCQLSFWWIEDTLLAEASRGAFSIDGIYRDKTVLSVPSTLLLTGDPCIHQLRSLSTRFQTRCELRIFGL